MQGLRHGGTALLRSAALGSAVVYAPRHVHSEVQRRLTAVAEARDLAVADLFRVWDARYSRVVRFVDVPPLAADERLDAVAAVDADDEPTARLAMLTSPSFLLSKDKALVRPGLATAEWLPVFLALQASATWNGAVLGLSGSVALAGLAVVRTSTAAIAHPRAAMTVAAMLLTLATLGRKAIAAEWPRLAQRMGSAGSAIATALGEVMIERERVLASFEGTPVDIELNVPLVDVTRYLARQRWPVTANAVVAGTGLSVGLVREILASHSAFVRVGQRWQLGDSGAPMSASVISAALM